MKLSDPSPPPAPTPPKKPSNEKERTMFTRCLNAVDHTGPKKNCSGTLRPLQTRKHCCRNILAEACFPKIMFPRLRAHETYVRKQKNVSDFFRNILFPQQMFPHLCTKETMLTVMLTRFQGHGGCANYCSQ